MTNNPAPSRYLVTGAAGFIGARVAEMLLADGHTVVGIDNLNDYYDVRLKDYRLSKLLGKSYELGGSDPKKSIFTHNKEPLTHNRFEFRVLDIENIKELDELFRTRKFEAVFSLAARAGVRYSMEHPEVYLSTNVLGTLNLLECQRKHGVKKQVLASTSSLYDGCPMPFTEDQPVNTPLSPYAATKKAAELMAYSYHKLYGLDISVARYFTVFGPAGRPDMSIFRFIKWIDEGKPLELFGDGTQSRDFTYIDDIARGTILAVKPFGYQIINLGGGRQPLSLTTVIAFIEKALAAAQSAKGKAARETLGSSPLPLSSSPVCAKIHRAAPHIADIKETWADIAKAKRLLGWKPQVTPEDGFRLTVDWHVANRSWLKGIKL
ncbi:MAG: NAD-dependent epimerase/dehydratase family protein [Lacunisphaera sp.]|nr:NAD-dependent epimerase/dehydratase family protein [Lacunisphaera sp.]